MVAGLESVHVEAVAGADIHGPGFPFLPLQDRRGAREILRMGDFQIVFIPFDDGNVKPMGAGDLDVVGGGGAGPGGMGRPDRRRPEALRRLRIAQQCPGGDGQVQRPLGAAVARRRAPANPARTGPAGLPRNRSPAGPDRWRLAGSPWRSGSPRRTLRVRQAWIAASLHACWRPRRPEGTASHCIEGSNQTVSDPRCFSASLAAAPGPVARTGELRGPIGGLTGRLRRSAHASPLRHWIHEVNPGASLCNKARGNWALLISPGSPKFDS